MGALAVNDDMMKTVPDHVPHELVRFFDFRTGLGNRPHDTIAELHKGPRIIYSPVAHQNRGLRHPGTWIVTKAEDIRYVLQHPEIFSSSAPRAQAMGESWRLIPLEVDPPEHGKYRAVLNPLFSPARLMAQEAKIRDWANELIDRLDGKTEADFITAFAESYPVGIFLDMMGLPRSELAKFRNWVHLYIHDRERRGEMMATTKRYLLEVIAERRKKPTQGDLVSFVLDVRIEEQPLDDDEAVGIIFLLFIGGLDTVVSSLSYQFRYLAEHPQEQQKLREDFSLIPDAVEELLRAFAVITTARIATQDTELCGVQVKEGDMVTTSTILSTRDPDEFANPDKIDLTRSPNRHNAFSFGPHRCLGSHLARREIIIAMEEFLKRIPQFRLKDGAEVVATGGGVLGLENLPIVWG
jgi:cytochrome P450